jgi:hypothetical protein
MLFSHMFAYFQFFFVIGLITIVWNLCNTDTVEGMILAVAIVSIVLVIEYLAVYMLRD